MHTDARNKVTFFNFFVNIWNGSKFTMLKSTLYNGVNDKECKNNYNSEFSVSQHTQKDHLYTSRKEINYVLIIFCEYLKLKRIASTSDYFN